ncbi:MAG TPA: MipA/OmpV family protein [Dongiaceae bacterium]|nr:MipA/OmpV family protein [Dongiaceae bacterium]
MPPRTGCNFTHSSLFLAAVAVISADLAFFPLPARGQESQPITSPAAAPPAGTSSANGDGTAGRSPILNKLAEWHVEIGAGGAVSPKFEGSKDQHLSPLPWFSATFGDRVKVNPEGIAVRAYSFDGFTLSGRLGYDLGRDEGDATHLNGLGDVDAGVNLGTEITYETGPLQLKATLDRTIGGSDGLVMALQLSYVRRFGRFGLSLGPSVTWADGNYMGSYFSVNHHQASRSGLSRYDADAGFKRVDFAADLSYDLTANWVLQSRANLGYLLPAASDSPVVQEKWQPSLMLGVIYKF